MLPEGDRALRPIRGAGDVRILVEVMERRRRSRRRRSPRSSATSSATLLGARRPAWPTACAQLDDAIRDGTVDDAATITYLTRRAYRDEWLHAPAVSLYPDREWSSSTRTVSAADPSAAAAWRHGPRVERLVAGAVRVQPALNERDLVDVEAGVERAPIAAGDRALR